MIFVVTMRKTENECVQCGLPCWGISCPNREVVHYYCDECGSEETLYDYEGEELCIECIRNRLWRIN